MSDIHIPSLSVIDYPAEFELTAKNYPVYGMGWHILDNYTLGDLDGIAGNLTYIHSDASGHETQLNFPDIGVPIKVSFTHWKDVHNFGALVYADDGTSVDGGNNFGIIFPESGGASDFGFFKRGGDFYEEVTQFIEA